MQLQPISPALDFTLGHHPANLRGLNKSRVQGSWDTRRSWSSFSSASNRSCNAASCPLHNPPPPPPPPGVYTYVLWMITGPSLGSTKMPSCFVSSASKASSVSQPFVSSLHYGTMLNACCDCHCSEGSSHSDRLAGRLEDYATLLRCREIGAGEDAKGAPLACCLAKQRRQRLTQRRRNACPGGAQGPV